MAFVESREGAGCPNVHRTVKEVNADIHSFYTVSPEGQILAVLTETELNSDLVFAFLTVVIRSGLGALTQAKNELITLSGDVRIFELAANPDRGIGAELRTPATRLRIRGLERLKHLGFNLLMGRAGR